ncbi:hypothetical protein PVK06_017092 [Gossypium arboreum]|uniref:Uncharacterized protein n=1 Tax=Gossypium arboreum TaxID=29729 RepID=A0ABR0Q2K4_GOSAR|nr:hypothetical protein PVK06_017092 [Gossypium arboreum]
MFIEEEYYINLHVGGKIVRDPYVSRTLHDNLRVVWNDSSTIDMINYWVKHKEIDLYVEHEINIVVFVNDESMLAEACSQFGGDGNEDGEGGEVVGSKCSGGEGGKGVGEGSEVAEGLSGKGDDVAINEGDGDDEEELQEAMQKVREVEGKTNRKLMITGAYLDQKMITVLMFGEEELGEIQRKVASEIHVNVNMIRCRRVKKMVKDNFTGNFVQEFAMLWDYADELRLKNPRSTIKMAVNRVTPEYPPHFKRFYVCFEALKKGWKEGCSPILGLDGYFLKGPFKGKLLDVVDVPSCLGYC